MNTPEEKAQEVTDWLRSLSCKSICASQDFENPIYWNFKALLPNPNLALFNNLLDDKYGVEARIAPGMQQLVEFRLCIY